MFRSIGVDVSRSVDGFSPFESEVDWNPYWNPFGELKARDLSLLCLKQWDF